MVPLAWYETSILGRPSEVRTRIPVICPISSPNISPSMATCLLRAPSHPAHQPKTLPTPAIEQGQCCEPPTFRFSGADVEEPAARPHRVSDDRLPSPTEYLDIDADVQVTASPSSTRRPVKRCSRTPARAVAAGV